MKMDEALPISDAMGTGIGKRHTGNQYTSLPMPERFWSRVCLDSSGCWIWTGYTDSWGYGSFSFHGTMVRAHRKAYELVNGHIPQGQWVLHTCDTPACVNPAHLYCGTHRDNVRDGKKRGRYSRGSKHYKAKLSEAEVVYIYCSKESNRELGRRFGINNSNISRIRSRKNWAHLWVNKGRNNVN
jgi:hypothetical protein